MKAMILAAGRGERMRPLTDTVPKPLLEAGGKPLVVWQIEKLARAGVRSIVINHAHLGHMIEQALGNGSRFGVTIEYSPEPGEALETAGGIAQALPRLGPDPFLVVNGDVYCDFDFTALAPALSRLRHANRMRAHLVLVDNPPHNARGDFGLAGDFASLRLTPMLTFSGIGLYRPELFAQIASGQKAKLAPLLTAAIQEGRVSAQKLNGYWLDVGTPQRLSELDARLRACKT